MKATARQTSLKTTTDLVRAMDNRRPVTITYTKQDGTETVRTVETFEIRTTKQGAVILRAMDRQSGEARTFTVSSIRAYTVHSGTYQVELPDTETPARPAPRTVAALVAFEIARDERPATTAAHFAPAA
ncbi:WYL domain-containing protein [Actinacidiphila acididurans]|uniref:WYL domain-containing protein n=1 Tax=Actinacidiphila acididurans TaxID=2784346 RepID=A0ABS2U3X7_9ACTN|nr:WYL domain-containing protein [Actinacidiphila acididurans]MBM9510042.1 WYL domain-containing protein [Actinacidiphila acididurans]